MEIFFQALTQTFDPIVLLCILAGTFLGAVIGALPGLGSVVGITIVLPFTFAMHSISAIALLLGVYGGSVYGGSICAILINTPGTPQSAATQLEGYPMAKAGKAGKAIGWATMSSVIGGIFSCIVLVFAAPQLASVALKFGPIETAALIFMGLSCISTVSSGGNILKGFFSGIIGLSLAMVGMDPVTGDMRFTFDVFMLTSGFDIVSVIVGIFAISEILSRVDSICRKGKQSAVQCDGMVLPKLSEWKGRFITILKSSIIGTIVGILPGAGAATASFISYGEAKRSSPFKDKFGTGEPDGIVAAEAANNAVTGGALIPSFALGLPGDPVTAVMLATLVMHGVVPGIRLMQDSPIIVYSSFITLFLVTLLLIPIGYILTKGFAKLLAIPEALLVSMITILCFVGTYGVRSNMLDLFVMVAMGFIGMIFRYFSIPAAPLVIGIVLGAQFERCIRQAAIVTDGNWLLVFNHPIALVLLGVSFILWVSPFIGAIYKFIKHSRNFVTITKEK